MKGLEVPHNARLPLTLAPVNGAVTPGLLGADSAVPSFRPTVELISLGQQNGGRKTCLVAGFRSPLHTARPRGQVSRLKETAMP